MSKNHFSVITAIALCGAILTACGGNNGDTAEATAQTGTTAVTTSPNIVTMAPDVNAVDPNEPVDLAAGITDKMYGRAILNEGNLTRLAAAMKKAENGEKVTVGVIGGSITQGSSATNQNNCYASLFKKWWEEKFPSAEISFVNAGIGGTNSYLGVHRVDEQLLAHNPDVVIVEFSVNDTDKTMNKYSYDSLVRKILSYETNPAVMLLFTTQENGTSLQDTHKEIGMAYDLPMISYREVVYQEVAVGTLDWKAISPDNIHPNDAGHGIIGQLVDRYLNEVYGKLDTITEEPTAFTAEGYTNDYFKNAKMLGADDITPTATEGFEVIESGFYHQFPNNWKTEAGGTMTFDVECQNFGVFFLCTTDGKSGDYEVYVDGERKGKLEADFTGGWGTYGNTKQLILSKETEKHTIEIRPAEGSEDKGITILGLMVS